MEFETKTDTHQQMDDLRLVRPRRCCSCCSPCGRRACAVLCLALTIAVTVLCGYVVPFAIRLEHGLAYMSDMKTHTSSALSLNGRNLSWYHVDDPVMGGHSASALEVMPTGSLRFFGNISTRDGGFASCATVEQPLGLSDATVGFRVAVEGNGELFKFTVHTSSSVWEPVWQVDFPPVSLERGVHSFFLPLASFTASRMGRSVHGATLRPSEIQAIGLNLALVDMHGEPNPHFRDGPFELTLHAVAAVNSAGAEEAAEAGAALAPAATSPAPSSSATATADTTAGGPAGGPAPSAAVASAGEGSVLLASFGDEAEGGAARLQWRVMDDPVMGGVSHSRLAVADGVATFSGTCAVVPFLRAPGFCRMATVGTPPLPDASAFADGGALYLTLRTSTPRYAGFKVGFSSAHMRTMPGVHHGSPSFKAELTLPPPPPSSSSAAAAPGAGTGTSSGSSSDADEGFVTVRVPFAAFSLDTSEYTGRCDTTDPTGQRHHCCTEAHPEVCPAAEHLRSLHGLQLWAEGVEGDFSLDVRSIAAGP